MKWDARYCKRCLRVGRIPPNERDSKHSYCKDCRREYAKDRYHLGAQFQSPLVHVLLTMMQAEKLLGRTKLEEGVATLEMARHRLVGILKGMGIEVWGLDVGAAEIESLAVMLAKLYQMTEGTPEWEGYKKIVKAIHPEWNEPDWQI